MVEIMGMDDNERGVGLQKKNGHGRDGIKVEVEQLVFRLASPDSFTIV